MPKCTKNAKQKRDTSCDDADDSVLADALDGLMVSHEESSSQPRGRKTSRKGKAHRSRRQNPIVATHPKQLELSCSSDAAFKVNEAPSANLPVSDQCEPAADNALIRRQVPPLTIPRPFKLYTDRRAGSTCSSPASASCFPDDTDCRALTTRSDGGLQAPPQTFPYVKTGQAPEPQETSDGLADASSIADQLNCKQLTEPQPFVFHTQSRVQRKPKGHKEIPRALNRHNSVGALPSLSSRKAIARMPQVPCRSTMAASPPCDGSRRAHEHSGAKYAMPASTENKVVKRAAESRSSSLPRRLVTHAEPFQLRTEKCAMLRKQHEPTVEELKPLFKARPWKDLPPPAPKKSSIPLTEPKDIHFSLEQRLEAWRLRGEKRINRSDPFETDKKRETQPDDCLRARRPSRPLTSPHSPKLRTSNRQRNRACAN